MCLVTIGQSCAINGKSKGVVVIGQKKKQQATLTIHKLSTVLTFKYLTVNVITFIILIGFFHVQSFTKSALNNSPLSRLTLSSRDNIAIFKQITT